jgi:hypothetical protein
MGDERSTLLPAYFGLKLPDSDLIGAVEFEPRRNEGLFFKISSRRAAR